MQATADDDGCPGCRARSSEITDHDDDCIRDQLRQQLRQDMAACAANYWINLADEERRPSQPLAAGPLTINVPTFLVHQVITNQDLYDRLIANFDR